MNIENQFTKSASSILNSKLVLDNDTKLELYGYYKQSTIGDINIPVPGFLEFEANSKYYAWSKHKGTSKENAMKRYCKKVDKLLNK